MHVKFLRIVFIVLLFIAVACSRNASMITGKWSLAGSMIGGAPSSFWFKWNGVVVAPWEKHNFALISEGTYEFVGDSHIKIRMNEGYYKGSTYYFKIIQLEEDVLVLGSEYEKIRLRKVPE